MILIPSCVSASAKNKNPSLTQLTQRVGIESFDPRLSRWELSETPQLNELLATTLPQCYNADVSNLGDSNELTSQHSR